jgi:hypothetical protein
MIDVTPPPPSPFSVGDIVIPVESADDLLVLRGTRTRPGIIASIAGGAHFVAFDGIPLALPYALHELEKADD